MYWENRWELPVSVSRNQLQNPINFQNSQADWLADNALDIELKYKRNSHGRKVYQGPELEEPIYRGTLETGFKTRDFEVDVMLAFLNNLVQIHITDQHNVKRIVYNHDIGKVMITAKTWVHVKEDVCWENHETNREDWVASIVKWLCPYTIINSFYLVHNKISVGNTLSPLK